MKHLLAGEVANLLSPDDVVPVDSTFALVKTEDFEAIRMVLPAGKTVPEHNVPGKITVQCITGEVVFSIESQRRHLKAGDWLFLEGGAPHALEAVTDCVLLVTILFPQP